jgi:MFS family permease
MQSPSTTDKAGKEKPFRENIVLAAGFAILLVLYGAQYSFGVFLKPILTDFGWTRAATAGAYSLNAIVFAISSVFAGKLSDRFSPGIVMTACGIIVSTGYFLMSQFTTLWQIYLIYGVLLSIGTAGVFITLLSTVAKWFITRMGTATGIVIAGIGAGIIIVPPLASFLITSYSWRISFMAIAAMTLLIPLVLARFFMRGHAHVQSFAQSNDSETDNSPSMLTQGFTLQQALHTRQLWIICGIYFISALCLQTLVVHIVAHATDVGIPANIAATILSVIGVVSIISKVSTGISLDRIKCRPILITIAILTSCSFLLLQLPAELWILYLFAALFAVGYGGWATTQSPTVAEYFGLKTHGAILGATFIGVGLGSALGPYAAGLIFDTTGSYSLAFWGCFVFCVIAIILPIMLKPTDKNMPTDG